MSEAIYRQVAEKHFPDYVFLIGLDEATAAAALNKKGNELHVAIRDGVKQATIKNIQYNRVNVVVVAGKIIGVHDIQ